MCSDWSNLSCRIFREAYFILGKNYLWVLWLYPWICAAPCLACKMTHLQNSVLHGDHLAPSVMVRYKLVAHWTGDQLILLLATDFRSCAMHLCYSFYCLTWKGGEFFCELPSELQLVPQGIVSDAKCERYQKKNCAVCAHILFHLQHNQEPGPGSPQHQHWAFGRVVIVISCHLVLVVQKLHITAKFS